MYNSPVISPQPSCFLPVVVLSLSSVLPRRFGSDSPRRINHSGARRRGRRRPTRKSLERMNLLYLLLCYAIIKTEDGAGQKEIMVFTQHRRVRAAVRDAVRGENNIRPADRRVFTGPEFIHQVKKRRSCCSSSSPRLRPPARDPDTDGRATSERCFTS